MPLWVRITVGWAALMLLVCGFEQADRDDLGVNGES